MEKEVKAQSIRLADVFFIGPVMVVGGVVLARKSNPFLGFVLAALGVGTVGYNYRNYLEIERRRRRRR